MVLGVPNIVGCSFYIWSALSNRMLVGTIEACFVYDIDSNVCCTFYI